MRFLILISVLFLILELNQLMLPAFHEEEAIDALQTLTIMKNLRAIFSTPAIKNLTKQPTKLPTIITTYHGALQSYLILPFFICLGPNAFSVRIYEIFVGLLIILATYFVTKEFFDKKVAYLAVVLLMLNFTFLGHTKLGIPYGSIMQFIILLSLLFFLRWYRQRNYQYFYLGCFLLGLGLSIRSWFIWFILGLFLESIVFRNELRKRFLLETIGAYRLFSRFIVAIIFFSLGSFLLIYYNLISNFAMVKYTFTHFLYTGGIRGINNLNYFQNLLIRIKQFISLLSGQLEFGFMYFQYKINYLFPLLFILCLIWLIYMIIYSKFTKSLPFSNKKVFFISLFFSIFLFTPTTLSRFRMDHLMILYPLVQILIAVAIVSFLNCFKGKIIRSLCIAFCFLVIISDFSLYINMMTYLDKTGGVELYSDSIYRLADFLKSQNKVNIYTFNFRLTDILSFLTSRKIQLCKPTHTIADFELDKNMNVDELSPVDFTEGDNLFVNHVVIDYPFIQGFYSFVERNNKRIIKKKQFFDRAPRKICDNVTRGG